MQRFTTKVTWLGTRYGCRIFDNGELLVEGRCELKTQIGATFRDMFRTIDKAGGDAFTHAARNRKWKEGNQVAQVRHIWDKEKRSEFYLLTLKK